MLVCELRKEAHKRKIKYYANYSKAELVQILNVDISNDKKSMPVQMINLNTGDIIDCNSIYKCAKLLGKKQGSISHFIKTGNTLIINDVSYKIEKI